MNPLELDLFLGKNYLVTCYSDPSLPAIEHTWDLIWKDNRISLNGPDFLCHTILDTVVDEFMPLIDRMENEVEWIEDSAMKKPTPETLRRLLSLKHSIISLRRIIAPQREVMNRLSRDEFAQIDAQSLIYFRDIYDHLVRIQDLADIIRDIVSGALDIYLEFNQFTLERDHESANDRFNGFSAALFHHRRFWNEFSLYTWFTSQGRFSDYLC